MMFKTMYNYSHGEEAGDLEVPVGVSMTIPDQSMSVQEILLRHSRGLSVPGDGRVPQYFGDDVVPDLGRMDKIDLEMYRRNIAGEIVDLRNRLKDEQEKKKAEQLLLLKQPSELLVVPKDDAGAPVTG